jgi:hypothetical protein
MKAAMSLRRLSGAVKASSLAASPMALIVPMVSVAASRFLKPQSRSASVARDRCGPHSARDGR